jgi:glyoxylase I family protein
MARIEHFAVFGNDLEALRAFYVEVMGLRVVLDNSGAPVRGYFLGDESGSMLEIIERPRGEGAVETRYSSHVAFWVEDYASARSRLAGGGVVFEPETEVVSEDFKTGFFRDPENNRCQIVWRKSPLGG